ncbi:hypothetical protein CDAR_235171 [Caerostris darwini]|uniref:Uncharacterized protein n=1 Tax=Caerostris darwini TaxID=1538125 RepID=A0AAV4MU43_9ARAC|nr:hypothetical protein CDAR_235171 [Caerostris darwini]
MCRNFPKRLGSCLPEGKEEREGGGGGREVEFGTFELGVAPQTVMAALTVALLLKLESSFSDLPACRKLSSARFFEKRVSLERFFLKSSAGFPPDRFD